MKWRTICICVLALGLDACVSSPKQTVLNLDTTDPRWTSHRCVAARKAVARYDDRHLARGVVGVAGNLVAPFAGTATSLAMSAAQDDTRAKLNHQVRAACISDPLAKRRLASRR